MSILKLGKFSSLAGVSAAATVTIGGGYLVVKKAKKASADTSHAPVSHDETVNFSSYEVGELKLDEKIQYFSKIMDGMIKLDEKRIKIPAGTGLNTINDINFDVVEGVDQKTGQLPPTLDDVLQASGEQENLGQELQPGQEEIVGDDEIGGDDSDSSGQQEAGEAEKTQDSEASTPTPSEKSTESSSEDGSKKSEDPSQKSGDDNSQPSTENKEGESTKQKTNTNEGNTNSEGDSNTNGVSPQGTTDGKKEQEAKNYVDNMMTALTTKFSSDKDAASILSTLTDNKDKIIAWLQLKK